MITSKSRLFENSLKMSRANEPCSNGALNSKIMVAKSKSKQVIDTMLIAYQVHSHVYQKQNAFLR